MSNTLNINPFNKPHEYRKIILNSNLIPDHSSNFEGSVSNEDFILGFTAVAKKTWAKRNKTSILTFGVDYGITYGKPQFFPLISFQNRINEKWSYDIGVPRTRVNFDIDNRHKLTFMASYNGIYANNSTSGDDLTDIKILYNSFDLALFKFNI